MDIRPEINVLSLCSGCGGFELGLRLALPAARTICYVERDAFAISILEERMREGRLDEAPVYTDATSFDGRRWRGVVDIVSAGYPCQAFSPMGKRKGKEDSRYLWPHVARIIRECEPAIVFIENVPAHIKPEFGFRDVVGDLCEMGYGCEAGLFSASEVGSSQARGRLFAVAYAQGMHARSGEPQQVWRESVGGRDGRLDGQDEQEMDGNGAERGELQYPPPRTAVEDWRRIFADNPSLKPAFPRRVDEMAAGLVESELANKDKQVRAMGNGVVPSCAAFAFLVLLGKALGKIPS